MAKDIIRWGIIGCGDVCEVKSGPALRKAEGSALTAVMRRNGALARDFAQRHGVPRWYDDALELIGDPEVDALYVATPPAFHKDYAVQALAAGKPVYVEKPMALNHAECLEMVEAARKAGLPLFVAYYRRALPRFLKVKELLTAGAIGEARCVRVLLVRSIHEQPLDGDNLPWRVLPHLSGGGLFVDLASHTLDLLDFLLGPIVRVEGEALNRAGLYPAEDMVSGSFTFGTGVQGVGTWCFCAEDGHRDEIEILGNRGRLFFSTFGKDPVFLEAGKRRQEFALSNPPHIQQPLIQTVVDELRGQGTCPSTGETAARASRVMDSLLAGYRAS